MKMRVLHIFFALFFLCFCETISAQNGTVRGSVFDAKTGEEMPGVTVMLEGTTYGTMSDLDGKFNFEAPPGTYTLRVSYISYTTIFIENVVLSSREITLFDNLSLSEVAIELTTVTITAEQTRNTETSMQTMKMKSPNMLDGISAVQFKRTGDSDAASSVKRVPGISVNDGKYIYVRGLGDRYTKTILNGVDIPGLDPDRNTIQMDIFPTNIIDNIVVHKSFRAELPADFTGGVVDIETKDFPEDKTAGISISAGYNPDFHFNSDYLTANGGSTDFLGFDDGTREIPATTNIPQFAQVVGNPDGENADIYKTILSSFNPNMAAYKKNSFMDYGLSFNYGNQIARQKHVMGYNFAFSYKNDTEFYEDAVFAKYGLNGDKNIYEMDQREYQTGNYGINNVFLSGLAGIAYKTQTFKLKINLLHLQNGESSAGIFDFTGSDQGSNFNAIQHNIDYHQRSLSNLYIEGKVLPKDSKWQYVWKLSPSFSKISDPDIRFTRYEIREGLFIIGTESGFPERIWRSLQEYNVTGLVHITRDYSFRKKSAKLLFGGSHTYKQRDFNIQNFAINVREISLTGNPDELFYEENLWPYNDDPTRGTTFETPFVPNNPNQFSANINSSGVYISTEISPFENLKTIVGVRMEYYSQNYTGQDQLGLNVLDNDNVLSEAGFFPTLNLVYNIAEKQNFRLSYSKTIARPSFKELSYAEIYDPISGVTFIGGLFRDANDIAGVEYWDGNLTSSDIHNADIRWEIFGSFEQTLSFSGFYKYFINPIEIVQYATQSGAIQPRNVGNGSVTGIEAEFKKNLFMNQETMSRLSIAGNITYTRSQIELSKTEFDSRTENAREGQTISATRDMAGQAPYIINGGILFQASENKKMKGLEAGLFYNVQGQTLLYAGIADRPDIYTVPFHSLNFNAGISVGKEQKIQLSLKIDNLLNSVTEIVYKSYMADDQLYRSLQKGRTVQVKFSYKFF
jgi:hypothetical protein